MFKMVKLQVFFGLTCAIAIQASIVSSKPHGKLDIRTSANGQKFEYVGITEGKIFVKAELPEDQRYGVSWQRAVEICSDSGYLLANIGSQAQEDVIQNYFTSVTSENWLWIDGSNFMDTNGTYHSLHTGKPLEFTNFVKGRPVTPMTKDRQCLRWGINSMETGWWDISCTDDKYNVLCQDNA